MKFYIFILLILVSNLTFGQSQINLIGEVVDFKANEPIVGVAIKMFDSNNLINTEFSTKDGEFNITLNENIKKVEFHFIGYLPLIIENFNSTTNKSEIANIKLYETPFVHIDYETKARRSDTRTLRKEQRMVKKGLMVEYPNGLNYKMRFSKKDFRHALYIDYLDLMECNEK